MSKWVKISNETGINRVYFIRFIIITLKRYCNLVRLIYVSFINAFYVFGPGQSGSQNSLAKNVIYVDEQRDKQ